MVTSLGMSCAAASRTNKQRAAILVHMTIVYSSVQFRGHFMKRNRYVGAGFVALLLAVGAELALDRQASGAAVKMAPMFEIDPLWPKPLPNHWRIGSTIG